MGDIIGNKASLAVRNVYNDVPSNYDFSYPLNGGSKDLTVNGAGTPVLFTYTPTSDRYIEKISLFLLDSGTPDAGDFGNLGALTNGLLIEYQSQGVLYTLANIKTNMDLANIFSDSVFSPSAGTQFFNNNDTFMGTLRLNRFIYLSSASSDFLRVTVRDNLTGIDFLQVGMLTWGDNP